MREMIDFGQNWRFCEEPIPAYKPTSKGPLYTGAKTVRMLHGPASVRYDETYGGQRWIPVTVPHDYIIAQTPDVRNNNTLGYFDYHDAWYRKHFRVEEALRGKRLTLLFEAAATHAEVYLNGCLLARNFCGYTSFEVDLTDFVIYGAENLLAVKIIAAEHEGWWYEGAGLVRPVWLTVTDPVAVDLWGVWANPIRMDDGTWVLSVETTIRNDTDADVRAHVIHTLIDPSGREIAALTGDTAVSFRDKCVLTLTVPVEDPVLWDIGAGNLYTVRTTVTAKEYTDTVRTRTGFRTFRFDPNAGFFLNGHPVKLKGVCCHQDDGLTGRAMPKRVHAHRTRLLMEMGANAYRAAHYPTAAYTMDALDEQGMLCLNETRWFSSSPEGLMQLEMLIRRDRSRPSVVLWSLGNEEPLHDDDRGVRIFRTMAALVRKLDPTRPITTAVSVNPAHAPVMDVCDVIGVNYRPDSWDALHAKYPTKGFVVTECAAMGTTRGWLHDDCPARGYFAAYDHKTNTFGDPREDTWRWIAERPWCAGGFQWAGIEHRGETDWPRLCSQSGALDLFLQKKDAFYQNLSHWSDTPMVHIVGHWNLAGREGETVTVRVYTNCPEVKLLQDGAQIGRAPIAYPGHAEFRVTYRPGSLRAEGYIGDECTAADVRETTGKPAALKWIPDDTDNPMPGDVLRLTCVCVDTMGRKVPDAEVFICVIADGGRIVGTGSDVADHTPVTCPDRRMYAGRVAAAVQPDGSGTLTVYAHADGLTPAAIRL